jgi:mono/diheme cytochrome c family protein
MARAWRPIVAGALVVVGVFLLAQWPIFEPSTGSAPPADSPAGGGSEARGQVLFEQECASCHGADAEGGIGPALADSGLDAATIAETIEQGAGIMPAGLVSGDDQVEVVAYVAAIANP